MDRQTRDPRWRMIPTTRRTSRDYVDIVSDAEGHIATYVPRHHAERLVRAVNTEGDPRLADADPRPGETVHPLACFHRKWRLALAPAREEYDATVRAVAAMLTDDQLKSAAWDELDAAFGMMLCAQQDHLVDVLATHFPGIGPAIRAIAYHADDDMDGRGTGACCWGEAGRPVGI